MTKYKHLRYRWTDEIRGAMERVRAEEGLPYQAQVTQALRAWLAGKAEAAAKARRVVSTPAAPYGTPYVPGWESK